MYSARVPSARLLSLAHYLQDAHDKQRRNCQRLETQYHALRRSTRDLERYWGLYCAELEDELGIPYWQTGPPELAPGRTDLGTLEALPTQPARQDQHRGRTGERTVERPSRYHGLLPSGNTQHRGSTSPDKTSSNKRIVEPRSPLLNPNPSPFEPTAAEYHLQFIRPATAIIALDLKSPLQQILADGIEHDEAVELLPPLNRFSDMAWYLWSDILARQPSTAGPVDAIPANAGKAANDPGRLRYIGHDLVRNPDTESIMFQIIRERSGGASSEAAWPGHTFSMQEPEGLALLGTPNAVGTVWMLVHRVGVLGRREPRVRIWTASPGYLCMLWYLDDA
ncbi:hypothetical protein Q9189_001073 [Teloschistes chrysophthalmus]